MYDRHAPARYGHPGPLSGTGRIADDLYLMAHDDATGRPLLARALGLGLAGGLLAELMLGRCIGLHPDGTARASRIWPDDGLGRRVRDQIAAEQPLAVRDWLAFLALTAATDVAPRLEQAGYLARARRRFPGRSPRWVPVDPDRAFAPLLRVRSALDPSRPWSAYDAALAGLAAASGLGFRISQYLAPGRTVQEATGPLDAGLRELITQTRAAVDSTVLSGRT